MKTQKKIVYAGSQIQKANFLRLNFLNKNFYPEVQKRKIKSEKPPQTEEGQQNAAKKHRQETNLLLKKECPLSHLECS